MRVFCGSMSFACVAVVPVIPRCARDKLIDNMDEPGYLICLQCETPTYQFEYANGKLVTAVCNTCGTDDPSDFMTEAELEEQAGA